MLQIRNVKGKYPSNTFPGDCSEFSTPKTRLFVSVFDTDSDKKLYCLKQIIEPKQKRHSYRQVLLNYFSIKKGNEKCKLCFFIRATISSFYRRIFIAYSKKLKNEREKIIHKHNYELLISAVKKGLQVCISLDNGHVYNNVSVYAIEPAKDELFNYVLCFSDKKNRTLRLAKIKTISLLAKNSEIPEESRSMFARQIAAGAQYPIYSTDTEPIKVQLSAKGRELFEKIYLYRPTPIAIEGDVYIFDCSANQVLYYFERFGSEALILSPKKLGIFMRNYYYFALKKYRSIYGKD